ncbi:MAG: HAD hydrolase family protein [Magnetococcales bacterium]|nr:HAD hydrolase family protein [Magnetococcales bacterium]
MVIVFDLDNTLVDELGRSLRPGIFRLLVKLQEDGHELVLWTSSPQQRAHEILKRLELYPLFSKRIYREDYDPDNTGQVKDIRIIGGDLLVDDDPKKIDFVKSVKRKGFLIQPFRSHGLSDPKELARLERQLNRMAMVRVVSSLMRPRTWF